VFRTLPVPADAAAVGGNSQRNFVAVLLDDSRSDDRDPTQPRA
jgi:hypothetical protein